MVLFSLNSEEALCSLSPLVKTITNTNTIDHKHNCVGETDHQHKCHFASVGYSSHFHSVSYSLTLFSPKRIIHSSTFSPSLLDIFVAIIRLQYSEGYNHFHTLVVEAEYQSNTSSYTSFLQSHNNKNAYSVVLC